MNCGNIRKESEIEPLSLWKWDYWLVCFSLASFGMTNWVTFHQLITFIFWALILREKLHHTVRYMFQAGLMPNSLIIHNSIAKMYIPRETAITNKRYKMGLLCFMLWRHETINATRACTTIDGLERHKGLYNYRWSWTRPYHCVIYSIVTSERKS